VIPLGSSTQHQHQQSDAEDDEVFFGPVSDRELLRIAYLSAMISAPPPKVVNHKPALFNIQPLLAMSMKVESKVESKVEMTNSKELETQQQQQQKTQKPKSFLPVPTRIKVCYLVTELVQT
jgi:hypothetical protein